MFFRTYPFIPNTGFSRRDPALPSPAGERGRGTKIIATIDTIVRRVGDTCYAIIKDERYPTLDWPTGKTIRICRAQELLGPYGKPGPPLSPSFREAPALIPSPVH